MFGACPGLYATLNKVNLQVNIFHCLCQRENLASRRLLKELDIVMEEVIQVVNFLKVKFLKNRDFVLR